MRQRVTLVFGFLSCALACGESGGEERTIMDGDDGAADGADGAENDDGSPGGACGRGDFPTKGEISFCQVADGDCLAIEEARGYTHFYGNVNLRGVSDLSALGCLEQAGGLAIANSPGLKDLSALKHVSELANLSLFDNAELTSLAGLEELTELSILNLRTNALTSLEGLPAGFTVNSLTIEHHEALTSLAGLENVAVVGFLSITQNPKLPQCEAEAYAARFPGVPATIEENDVAAVCD